MQLAGVFIVLSTNIIVVSYKYRLQQKKAAAQLDAKREKLGPSEVEEIECATTINDKK